MEKWRFQFQPDQRRSLVLSCPTHTKTTSLEKRLPTSEESCVEHAGGRDTERVTLEDKGGTRRLNRVAVLETQESHGGRHSPAHPSRSGGRERGETLQTKSNNGGIGRTGGSDDAGQEEREGELLLSRMQAQGAMGLGTQRAGGRRWPWPYPHDTNNEAGPWWNSVWGVCVRVRVRSSENGDGVANLPAGLAR